MSERPIKILLIEENLEESRNWYRILSDSSEGGFETVQKSTIESAISSLDEGRFDLILLSFTALDSKTDLSIEQIPKCSAQDIPIIVVLEEWNEAATQHLYRMGVQDVLGKGHVDPHLFRRILFYACKLRGMKIAIDKKERVVADQMKMLEKYQDNNDLLQAIMDETTDTLFVKDDQGRYLMLNSTAAKNFGKSPEELVGRTNRDLAIPEKSKKAMEESDRTVLASGKSISYEVTLNGPDGPRIMFTTKSPYRDRNGKIIGLIGISRDITEQKLAEETLRTEHAYRKPIEEAMLAGVVAMEDVTGKLLYANPAFCKIVGWRQEELVGRTPPFPFWPPDDIENILQILKSRLASDNPPDIEISFQRKNGERFPALIKTAPLSDGHGNKIGIVSTIGDIKNQKLSENRLRESHNLLRSIIEGTIDPVYLRDTEGRYLMINSSGAEYLGKPADKIIGKHLAEFFSPEDAQKIEELDQRVLNSGKIETVENKIAIDGMDHIFLTTRGPILNHENKISGVFGISRDITERKRAEEILQKSEERLSAVIDNSTAVIHMKDLAGNFLLINKKFEDIFRVSKKNIVGKTVYDFFPVKIAEKLQANDQLVIKKKGPIEFDETVPHDDGPHDYLSVRFPLLDNRGEVYAVCGIATDITDRKSREEDHMKMEKLESLGLLAGGIAHDFNNILTAIIGNISLAKSFVGTKEQLLTRLNEAERASLRASELSQQLLTFSKGGAPIKKTVSLQSLIEHSVQFALTGSNVQSQLVIQEDLWPVEADEGQMNQVIQNLVINAKQSMPLGGTIRIEAKNLSIKDETGQDMELRRGDYLLISIQDQGTGIPKEHLSKIFDPYFTTKSKGSGLGLSITHSIIKRHQGIIAAESNPEGGTIFFIYLPASPQAIVPEEYVELEAMFPGKGKVLVIDDEESILNLARGILTHLGYQVGLAKNGSDALRLFKDAMEGGDRFDLVVTDLTIPGDFGGVEILRKLKEIDPQVKVVVSSGYSNDPAMADFKAFGFSDTLKKPYRAFEVSQTVKRVLKTRRIDD